MLWRMPRKFLSCLTFCAGHHLPVPGGGGHQLFGALQLRPGPHHRVLETHAGHEHQRRLVARLPHPQVCRQEQLHVSCPVLCSASLLQSSAVLVNPQECTVRLVPWVQSVFEARGSHSLL